MPTTEGDDPDWFPFMRPFSVDMWLGVFCIILAIAVTHAIVEGRVQPWQHAAVRAKDRLLARRTLAALSRTNMQSSEDPARLARTLGLNRGSVKELTELTEFTNEEQRQASRALAERLQHMSCSQRLVYSLRVLCFEYCAPIGTGPNRGPAS